MIGKFDRYAVGTIGETLNALGLQKEKEELVVVGGAAMAAFGIKPLKSTDLDIVVSDDLFSFLRRLEEWTRIEETSRLEAIRQGIPHSQSTYDGLITRKGNVTAITAPLADSAYNVSGDILIAEGIMCKDSYRISPVARILDWKLALVDTQRPSKDKHFNDAKLI